MKETWRRMSWGEAVGPVQRQTVYRPAKRHRPRVRLQPKRHRHGPVGPPAVWEPRPRSAYCAFISCFIAQFWAENQVSGTAASRRATAAEPRAALKWRDTLFGGLNAPCSLGRAGEAHAASVEEDEQRAGGHRASPHLPVPVLSAGPRDGAISPASQPVCCGQERERRDNRWGWAPQWAQLGPGRAGWDNARVTRWWLSGLGAGEVTGGTGIASGFSATGPGPGPGPGPAGRYRQPCPLAAGGGAVAAGAAPGAARSRPALPCPALPGPAPGSCFYPASASTGRAGRPAGVRDGPLGARRAEGAVRGSPLPATPPAARAEGKAARCGAGGPAGGGRGPGALSPSAEGGGSWCAAFPAAPVSGTPRGTNASGCAVSPCDSHRARLGR